MVTVYNGYKILNYKEDFKYVDILKERIPIDEFILCLNFRNTAQKYRGSVYKYQTHKIMNSSFKVLK